MQHIAILSRQGKILSKILSGEKTIESRWYKHRRNPWNTIAAGETVYFKESGEPVSATAIVDEVMQFQDFDAEALIDKYGPKIGVDSSFARQVADKRYCILIFLKNVRNIDPFTIDKTGYGLMSAWLCVDDVSVLRKA